MRLNPNLSEERNLFKQTGLGIKERMMTSAILYLAGIVLYAAVIGFMTDSLTTDRFQLNRNTDWRKSQNSGKGMKRLMPSFKQNYANSIRELPFNC